MEDYENIRQRLIERREALSVLVGRVEKSARRKLDKDFEEQAIQRENEEVLTSLDESLNEELKQIGHALSRMDAGEYGKCETCGEEISIKRLEAVPHASYCIKCAV
jgi:RNA polymerase-binding protein DksA